MLPQVNILLEVGAQGRHRHLLSSPHSTAVQIGVSKKEDVQQLLGPPMAIQTTSGESTPQESWAYAAAEPIIQPYQYIPLIGAYAFRDSPQFSLPIQLTFPKTGLWKALPGEQCRHLEMNSMT